MGIFWTRAKIGDVMTKVTSQRCRMMLPDAQRSEYEREKKEENVALETLEG